MAPGLTADDLERIDQFVQIPRHCRRPTMLCPDAEGGCPDSRERGGANEG